MRTTIIYEAENDSSLSHPINTALKKSFTSPDHTLLEVKKEAIKPCIGCFGCWTKTPGKCMIKGDMIEQTNPAFVQSDYLIIASNIHYGCYSAAIKRIIDRFIPNILPFFRTYKNEMHHEPRYKKIAKMIIIAYDENITPSEKETFLKLTRANATNMNNDDPTVYFCTQPSEIPGILQKIQKQITL